jgi:Transposase
MSQSKELEATTLGEGELPESKVLDHLGLVAGMFEELEIGDRIDEHIAQDLDEREVSVGQAVKAMVLNGFGFVQQRLYLTPEFFERVPTERLVGEGVRPEHLNHGVLGRALDDLFEYGVTELFRDLAANAAEKLGLTSRFAHLARPAFRFTATMILRRGLQKARFVSNRAIRVPSPGSESGCPRHGCPSGRPGCQSS